MKLKVKVLAGLQDSSSFWWLLAVLVFPGLSLYRSSFSIITWSSSLELFCLLHIFTLSMVLWTTMPLYGFVLIVTSIKILFKSKLTFLRPKISFYRWLAHKRNRYFFISTTFRVILPYFLPQYPFPTPEKMKDKVYVEKRMLASNYSFIILCCQENFLFCFPT